MCDLAVFVNRHTLPSRTVTDDRHRARASHPERPSLPCVDARGA